MNISALNDTTVLAKRLVMGLAWKLDAWWKKWSDCSGLHWSRKPREVKFWTKLVSKSINNKFNR